MVWPPLLWLYVAILLAFLGQFGWFWWRDRRVADQLAAAKPVGGWHLRDFAGDPVHRGAGRALLERICANADTCGRVLYLDTAVPRLVAYYQEAGFEVVARVPAVYAGEEVVVTRMVRVPR